MEICVLFVVLMLIMWLSTVYCVDCFKIHHQAHGAKVCVQVDLHWLYKEAYSYSYIHTLARAFFSLFQAFFKLVPESLSKAMQQPAEKPHYTQIEPT